VRALPTLSLFLQPVGFAVLLVWSFAVLSAAQLTIRLIMAFSVRQTLVAAVLLALLALPIAAMYDLALGPQPSLTTRLELAPLPMLLMAASGLTIARWVLRVKRLRGQIIAALMVGVLDPHLFTLVAG
jgi:hypothetical protein